MVDGGLWPVTRPSHVGCERAEVVVGQVLVGGEGSGGLCVVASDVALSCLHARGWW